MAVQGCLTLLLLSLVLATQTWGRRPPLEGPVRREATQDDVTAGQSQRAESLEGKVLARLQAMEEGLGGLRDTLQGLESRMTAAMGWVLARAEQRQAREAEVRANRTEERLASLMSETLRRLVSAQADINDVKSSVTLAEMTSDLLKEGMTVMVDTLDSVTGQSEAQTRLLNQTSLGLADLQASVKQSSADLQASVNQTSADLQASVRQSSSELATRVSGLEGRLDVVTHQAASSENATESLLTQAQARLLTRADANTAALQAAISGVQRTSSELATQVSTLEGKLDTTAAACSKNMTKVLRYLEDPYNALCGGAGCRTCQDYVDHGLTQSGVRTLHLGDGQGPIDVYCDIRDGTGWTVFQRRQDGLEDFYRGWSSYEHGFGDLNGEFWLGNQNIHRLTRAGLTELRVDLQAFNGSTAYARYSRFLVGNASSSYRLTVSGYSGTAGNSLGWTNGNKFTTKDRDNDRKSGNCAQERQGAWWHDSCTYANPNGLYGTKDTVSDKYVTWHHWFDNRQALQRTELKLR